MSPLTGRPSVRWLVPVLVATVLALGGSAIGAMRAVARDQLPDRTAAELLVDVQKAELVGLSGTIELNSELGLPTLPGLGGGSSEMSSLVAGSHKLRLWYADPEHVRVALLGSLGESDVVRNGTDLWTWSSNDKTATHRTLEPSERGAAPKTLPMTPQQAAEMALSALEPTTRVSTDGTAVVAGRPAYELVLEPRDSTSLVGSVRIAVDGETHVPTRVQVTAAGASDPAFEVGFTAFDPTEPAGSRFDFTPPPGTEVTEADAHERGHKAPADSAESDAAKSEGADRQQRVVGTGWSSVVVAELPAVAAGSDRGDALAGQVLESLPRVSGDWGSGRLLRSTLFSVLVTDDGRVAAGAVTPDQLYRALSAP